MNKPLVSVILPVFNAGRLLSEAIESILNQTLQDIEIIIINDGSTDGSLGIIKKFAEKDKRIIVISHRNKGLVPVLNEALEMARGEFIARQDADDISLPFRLEKQITFLQKNPKVGLVGTNMAVINNEGKRVNRKIAYVDFLTQPDDLKLAEIFSNQFAHGSIVIRRETIGDERYDHDYKYAEDYDFWSRLSRRSKVANLQEPLYNWRLHEEGITSHHASEMTNQALRIARREFEHYLDHKDEYKFFSLHPFSMRGGLKSYLKRKNAVYRDMALMYCHHGMRRQSLPILLLAVAHAPWIGKNYRQLLATLLSRDKVLAFDYELF
jgi:glycosyltransferase involved in cell wall biosynthesis